MTKHIHSLTLISRVWIDRVPVKSRPSVVQDRIELVRCCEECGEILTEALMDRPRLGGGPIRHIWYVRENGSTFVRERKVYPRGYSPPAPQRGAVNNKKK